MTTEALDLLDRLSSPELAQKAEKDANRPFDRFPGKSFKADIPSQELDVISRRPTGSNFDQWGIYLTVDVTEVFDGNVEPGEHQLWIRTSNPTTRDGKENKRTLNSELVQMVTAAGRSVRSWPGNKGVTFTEDTYDYFTDKNTNVKGPDGKDIWERNVPASTYFYRLNFSGVTVGNGSKPAAEPTEEAVEKAMSLIIDAGDEGVAEVVFNLACSKDPLIKKDAACIGYISSGSFAKDMIGAGRILRAGANLVVAG